MTRKGGLGRGLGALIPGAAVESAPAGSLRDIPVEAIAVNPMQPRANFDEEAQESLTESVRELGVLQPLVVREGTAGYELVAGERRLRAARAAGLTSVPAVVRETADEEMLRTALVENIQREALNPLEEAAAYRQLLDDLGLTHDDLAGRVGRSRTHVSNTIRLLNLPASVQRRVAAGVLSAGHARALLGLSDATAQERLAARAVAEGMSVRAVEEAVAAGEPSRRAAPRAPREQPPALGQVAERLGELLETRVRVEMGRRKGRIVVEFASPDDLDRIVSQLALSLEVAGFRERDPAQ